VEDSLGATPADVELPWWTLLWMGLRDGIVLVLRSLLFTVPLLVAGFVPVVGQTVVPVLLALVTGWFLALELVAVSFYRRGMNLTERRAMLRKRRGLALGLGLPATLLCAIPLAAIIVMPFAFVGGVLVARECLRSPEEAIAG
jgi:CysZ protein